MTAAGRTASTGAIGGLSKPRCGPESRRTRRGRAAGPGNTIGISYEDKEGHWHHELADGRDRPVTNVKG